MTGFTLKLIALVSMLIDHILKSGIVSQGYLMEWFHLDIPASAAILNVLEPIGRLAFPIFAYMIAEGMRHTRSRTRYILQLLIFGLISEWPFDMAFSPIVSFPELLTRLFTPLTNLNIFFTLALGALGIELYERLKPRSPKFALIPPALCALTGLILNVDYSIFGVLLIYAAYFPKKKAYCLPGMACVLAVLYLGYASSWFTAFGAHCVREFAASCLSLVLLALYNGKRGRKIKWLFYAFYPAHLAILTAIKLIWGLGW